MTQLGALHGGDGGGVDPADLAVVAGHDDDLGSPARVHPVGHARVRLADDRADPPVGVDDGPAAVDVTLAVHRFDRPRPNVAELKAPVGAVWQFLLHDHRVVGSDFEDAPAVVGGGA